MRRNDALVLNFRGIPDGVTVKASLTGTGEAMEADGTDLAPLMLTTGEDAGADKDGVVSLSSAGAGEVVYTFVKGTYDHDGDMSMEEQWIMVRYACYDCSSSPCRRRHDRME